MKHDMKHGVYAKVRTCMWGDTVLLFAEWNGGKYECSQSVCMTLLFYAGASFWEQLTYLCIVELCLHIQRLQNLIENRLQTESWSFLTLYVHSTD